MPPVSFSSNYCTLSPDWWPPWSRTNDLRPACHLHDYHYSAAHPLGGDENARLASDVLLYWNLQRCGAPRWVAAIYYRRVRALGIPHFAFEAGARPGRWKTAVSRWVGRYRVPRELVLCPLPPGPEARACAREAILA